jgi:hypothetical protein
MVDIVIRAPENVIDYLGDVLTLINDPDASTPEEYVAKHAITSCGVGLQHDAGLQVELA